MLACVKCTGNIEKTLFQGKKATYIIKILSLENYLRRNQTRDTKLPYLKPGLHEPQLPVERRVTLVSSIIVERRR